MISETYLMRYRWAAIAAFYVSLAYLFYHNTSHSKFIFDWNTWMVHYINEGWDGLASCYGDRSMRWGYHLMNMLFWKVFGLSEYGWFLSCLLLHVANALLLALLVQRVLVKADIKDSFVIGSAAGLIWLLSPYHSETVVWGATTLFLAMTFQVLAGMLFFLRYSESLNVKMLLLVYVCYFCAMFTFEAFVPFPLLLFILMLIVNHTKDNRLTVKSFVLFFFLPMIVSIVVYFVANKFRIGSWVGHYGEASHLNTDIDLLVPNLSKYLLKLFYVPLWFTFPQRDGVYVFLEGRWQVIGALVFYVSIASFLLYKFFTSRGRWKVPIGLLAMFGVGLVPVVNLYFMYYKDIEQDRYVYFASAFFYPALLIAFYLVFKRWAIIPILFFVFVSAKFLHRNNYCWSESGRISKSLMNDFRWQNSKRVFVLLTPDNFNGAYCMRSMPESTLREMLYVQRGIDVTQKIVEVYQWNVVTPNDSAVCEVIDSTTLEVKLFSQGGWLWRNSFGASDFENEKFKATLNKWHPWFTIAFKDKQPGDVFIYAVNDHWEEVKNF